MCARRGEPPVHGLGFGFGVSGIGLGVEVQGSLCRVEDLGFRVAGYGLWV